MVFSKDVNLSSVYVLSFLANHDRSELKDFFDKEETAHLSPDLPATISLDSASKTFTASVDLIGGATNHSTWSFERPGTIFKDLVNVKGTIFMAAHSPMLAGGNQCWLQQYPCGSKDDVGRTVIEFYTDKVITAVFKTDADNFGAAGRGEWITPGINNLA